MTTKKHYTVIVNEYGATELIADEGWWLYNGFACSQHVYLGKYDKEENWHAVDHYIEPGGEEDQEREDKT